MLAGKQKSADLLGSDIAARIQVLIRDGDDDLPFGVPGFDIGQRIPGPLKWEHLVDDWTDDAGFDQGRNLTQLLSLRAHE